MRPRLVLPAALQVVALSACGNSPAPPTDAASADRAETAVADALTDVLTDALADAGDACVLPDSEPFGPQPGFACARAADAGSTVRCPAARVCTREACGAGCEACEATLFCIPDVLPDGGRPKRCAQDMTCSMEGCGAGCRAVG